MQTFETKRRWQNAKQKKELIEKFNEWNGRPAPIFEVDEIDEAFIDDINDNVNNYYGSKDKKMQSVQNVRTYNHHIL